MKLRKSRVMPVGIDLGTGAVKLAQLREANGQLELVAAAAARMPQACRDNPQRKLEFLADRLPDLMRTEGFKGRQCVVCVPAAESFVQHVRTPKLPEAELARTVQWELEGKVPFDLEDAVVRHVVAGETHAEGQPGLEVIVLAVARDIVEDYLSMARKARLDIVSMDVEPCAILECFARLFRRREDSERVTLFLDLGEASTQVVVAQGARLVFARNLMVGSGQLDQAAAKVLGLTAEEVHRQRVEAMRSDAAGAEQLYDAMEDELRAMGQEVTNCLRYYDSVFPSRPVERAIFLGGQALDRSLCQRLAQRLNLAAQIGDPLTRINTAPASGPEKGIDRRQPQPAWAVAVGLSLGARLSRAA